MYDFRELAHYANQTFTVTGIDSPDDCLIPHFFKEYPYEITYKYNEKGYRDRSIKEWQKDSILAIGDSFTVGLGVPVNYTWPCQLESMIGRPVLNFSMNGASNNWIARKTLELLNYFEPPAICIMWSFTHRRELNNPGLADDRRILHYDPVNKSTYAEDFDNWAECCRQVENNSAGVPIIHSFIANWHLGVDYSKLDTKIPVIPPLDQEVLAELKANHLSADICARDGVHYGTEQLKSIAKQYYDSLRIICE